MPFLSVSLSLPRKRRSPGPPLQSWLALWVAWSQWTVTCLEPTEFGWLLSLGHAAAAWFPWGTRSCPCVRYENRSPEAARWKGPGLLSTSVCSPLIGPLEPSLPAYLPRGQVCEEATHVPSEYHGVTSAGAARSRTAQVNLIKFLTHRV